ncbi:hypothetical protein HKX48_008570 [Thoreauomyces humboldtii]|nr:hypothetical protein HKX48_008570 [Thoreauomyces humboldtii]
MSPSAPTTRPPPTDPTLLGTLSKRSPNFVNASTLLSELAFVSWFHSSSHNQRLHILSVGFGLALLSASLASIPISIPMFTSLGMTFLIPSLYVVYFTYLIPRTFHLSVVYMGVVGCLGLVLSSNGPFSSRSGYGGGGWTWTIATLSVAILSFVMQGTGHVVFEAKRPAFRLFEAGVTAPFATVLWTARLVGAGGGVADEVLELAEGLARDPVFVREFVVKNVPGALDEQRKVE